MKISKIMKRFAAFSLLAGTVLLNSGCQSMVVFDPKGPIGAQQRDLIYFTMLLCLIVLVPVLLLTAWIVWRFRDKKGNTAPYQPNWAHSAKLETIWWGIPIVIIITLAIVTARYTYALDPAKPIESDVTPLTIQVTSLDWKWLFLYPEQGVATVNYLVIPEDTPIRFELTSDGPMNSFWVPQLGGMIYTMSGMSTTLYLQADEPGDYMGSGANFTGREYAKMRFTAKAVTQTDFEKWLKEAKMSGNDLTEEGYLKLAQPGTSGRITYGSIPAGLFHRIVHDYSMNRGAPAGLSQKARTLSEEHANAKERTAADRLPPDHNPQNEASNNGGRSDHSDHSVHSDHSMSDRRTNHD